MLSERKTRILVYSNQVLSSFNKYEYDERTGGIFINNTFDDIEYNNYYAYIIGILNQKYANAFDVNDLLTEYLDMGYVPYVMPPTFMTANNCSYLKMLVEKAQDFSFKGEKLRLLYEKPVRLSNTLAGQLETDIWVSRLQLAKFLNCKPEDVTMLNMFKLIIQGGINHEYNGSL